MSKLAFINVIGTVALAAILYGSHMSPTLAAGQDSAQVVKASFMFEQAGSEFTDAYLALTQSERDRLLFRLADDRSMQLLALARAHKATGPMDAR